MTHREKGRKFKAASLRRHLAINANPAKPWPIRKRSARRAACLAEQLGIIDRPKSCEWCRRRARLERHHWDYSRPLLVTFLCGECHEVADRMTRLEEAG